MARVAVVTDSAADLGPDVAREHGIAVVPLLVTFGQETFRAGVELSTPAFWSRMLAPGAPFPKTAAAGAGDFLAAFEACFDAGADSVVCVDVGSRLSATYQSAVTARGLLPEREIHVIDSGTASMGVGLLAIVAAELAARGLSGAEVAAGVSARAPDIDLYVGLDTLEYLRRGGRMSGATAAAGTLLSIKPIVTVRDGVVENLEKVRTRGRARERVIELLTTRPVERLAILHAMVEGVERFRDEVVSRLPQPMAPDRVLVQLVGPSIGPHIGPGALGGVVMLAREQDATPGRPADAPS